ncbi:hypothetical protein [Haladaptatus salinisoli]|nr:hypothetical protein [Haladaptatus salinisoli]
MQNSTPIDGQSELSQQLTDLRESAIMSIPMNALSSVEKPLLD